MAAFFLRTAVKDAWFSADARGDFSAIDANFWSRTEPAFYRQLKSLIETARVDADGHDIVVHDAWHQLLIKTAVDLFDADFVGAGPVERQNPRRIAKAFQQLNRSLRGPKIRQSLGLPPDASHSKGSRRAAKRAA